MVGCVAKVAAFGLFLPCRLLCLTGLLPRWRRAVLGDESSSMLLLVPACLAEGTAGPQAGKPNHGQADSCDCCFSLHERSSPDMTLPAVFYFVTFCNGINELNVLA
jgi:hypothetical protein